MFNFSIKGDFFHMRNDLGPVLRGSMKDNIMKIGK